MNGSTLQTFAAECAIDLGQMDRADELLRIPESASPSEVNDLLRAQVVGVLEDVDELVLWGGARLLDHAREDPGAELELVAARRRHQPALHLEAVAIVSAERTPECLRIADRSQPHRAPP